MRISDWSSDVCSSDLDSAIRPGPPDAACRVCRGAAPGPLAVLDGKSYLWCARCEATLMAWADLPDAAAEEEQERLHRQHAADPAYAGLVVRLLKTMIAFLRPGDTGPGYPSGRPDRPVVGKGFFIR